MTSSRTRLQALLDRCLAVAVVDLIAGTSIGFGGAAWWSPAIIAGLTSLLVVAWLSRALVSGSWRIMKSPLTLLGALAIAIGCAQVVAIPPTIARMVSPRSVEVNGLGTIPTVAVADDPDADLGATTSGRTPLSIDRPATLRWVAAASACLALFWVVSHFVDRLGRLYLVWGSVVAAFFLNTALIVIQLVGQVDGLYGFIQPGQGPRWAPTLADAIDGPGDTVLRAVVRSKPIPHAWALARPDNAPMLGTMLGGPGAYLAIGALGLPLILAATLQLMAPRGSREPLWARLADSSRGSLLILLYAGTILGAGATGLLAGPVAVVPFAIALALVGLPSLIGSGLRWKGFILTGLTLASLYGGVALGDHWGEILPRSTLHPRVDMARSVEVWKETLPILKDFPIVGAGVGGFAAVAPYYKTHDSASTTARSSLLQWWVGAGAAGLSILAPAGLWMLIRLPGAIGRVGSADRALAFGTIGAVACFAMISTIHWTVELPAVALAASAVVATFNRWLAGGADLFVDRAR